MFALSSLLSAHVPSDHCIDGIVYVVNPSRIKSFIVFQNCFLLMFLEKKDYFNIDVTSLCMPLYFLQSSVDPDDFDLWNKVFPLLHCTFQVL